MTLSHLEKKDRKRLQDRRNQRARRLRMKEKNHMSQNTASHEKSFQVQRWRLDEGRAVSPDAHLNPVAAASSDANGLTDLNQFHNKPHDLHVPPSHVDETSHPETLALTIKQMCSGPPLPVDHILLHLVKHNAGRGLNFNKSVFRTLATFSDAGRPSPVPDTWSPCSVGVVEGTHPTTPSSLWPTSLQMRIPHPSWIDIIPFPEIRDNLICQQNSFNHIHFLNDIVGDLVYTMPSDTPRKKHQQLTHGSNSKDIASQQVVWERKGLILWGNPYLKDSWEAAPGFLNKWAWAVRGCGELVDASNKWRRVRGEADLLVNL